MRSSASIAKKAKRLAQGGKLRVLDLFAGCGGFSLGFHRAGYSILGAIEADAQAMASHAMNFARQQLGSASDYSPTFDITTVDPSDYLRSLGIQESPQQTIDVVIGGPPCQAFARIGRAKLREIANDPNAHTLDKRANLVGEYIRFVDALRPMALVIENVPDMMNQRGVNVVANVCETLSDLGYVCRYTLLNAAFYGVPQFRERVFIIGLHESLSAVPKFPKPTHTLDLPAGYLGTRSVAMKPISGSDRECEWFAELPIPESDLPDAICSADALMDLPKITEHLFGQLTRGIRRLDCAVTYSARQKLTGYAKAMRTWPGFSTVDTVTAHVIRSLPRDFETFRRMEPGDQYPEAHKVAVKRFNERLSSSKSDPICESLDIDALWDSIVPPYDPSKFPNKWWKLEPNRPSRTLTAHMGKDTYSHIHFDSKQARTISVREAARLQSFPDGFLFAGAMNAAFRQIGNAVPPLMAYAVARQLRKQLAKAVQINKVRA